MSTPDSISGLQLWLRASDITGLADGEPVASWPDSSGNGRAATMATLDAQPTFRTGVLNGQPSVRFDGIDDRLVVPDDPALDLVAGITQFVVFRANATGDGVTAKRDGGGSGYNFYAEPGGSTQWTVDTGSNSALVGSTVITGAFCVATGTRAGDGSGEVAQYVNGTSEGSGPVRTGDASNAVDFHIGCLVSGGPILFLDGDIVEVIHYDRHLAAWERAAVHSYLQDTYGIAVSDYDPGPSGSALLLEDGSYFRLEDGSYLLLEGLDGRPFEGNLLVLNLDGTREVYDARVLPS